MALNTITLQQAQKWAQNWRENPSPDENGKYKLMIVGVDTNGNDLIDDAAGQYIYDFTTGCPKVCDVNSPLFRL
jgi:hypothetical protein